MMLLTRKPHFTVKKSAMRHRIFPYTTELDVFFFLFVHFLTTSCGNPYLIILSACANRATDIPLRIDCGSSSPQDINGTRWQADAHFSSGDSHTISTSYDSGLTAVEASLRSFPTDKMGCYDIPVPAGRYLVRLGFAYYNYDSLNQPPFFDVLLHKTLVETVDMGTVQAHYSSGAYYSDYIVYALQKKVSICLESKNLGNGGGSASSPLLNSIELLPVDTDAYQASKLGQDVILSQYVRLNLGGPRVGPEPEDPGFRVWTSDVSPGFGNYTPMSTTMKIQGTESAPEYLPESIFQTARLAGPPVNATGFRMTLLPIEASDIWLLQYYFAEIDPSAKVGDRVFDILLGSQSAFKVIGDKDTGFDILAKTTDPLTALTVPVFFNYEEYAKSNGQDLQVGVRTRDGSRLPAIFNAVELFEVIRVGGQRKGKSGLSGVAIAAIVIGSVLGFLLVGGVIFLVTKKQGRGNFVPVNSS